MNTIDTMIMEMITTVETTEQKAARVAAFMEHVAEEYSFWTINIFAYGFHTDEQRKEVYKDFLSKRILKTHRFCDEYKRGLSESDSKDEISLQP
jgi:hypothetical protein